jgi:hypothetical protein
LPGETDFGQAARCMRMVVLNGKKFDALLLGPLARESAGRVVRMEVVDGMLRPDRSKQPRTGRLWRRRTDARKAAFGFDDLGTPLTVDGQRFGARPAATGLHRLNDHGIIPPMQCALGAAA